MLMEEHQCFTLLQEKTRAFALSIGSSPHDVNISLRNSASGETWYWSVSLRYSYLPHKARMRVSGTLKGQGHSIDAACADALENLCEYRSARRFLDFTPAAKSKSFL